jgi:ankyrin repeat protein
VTTTTSEIFEAIAEGDLDRARNLVAEDAALAGARDADWLSAVTQARYRGHDDIVDALLDAEPELDVFEAAAVGRIERVRELLESDPALVSALSPDGFTPLHEAAQNGDVALTRLLLERGADREQAAEDGGRAADFAAARGHEEVLALLGKGEVG